jgi:hypothetical protein
MGDIGGISRNKFGVHALPNSPTLLPLSDSACTAFLCYFAQKSPHFTSTFINTHLAITPGSSRDMSSSMNFGALVYILFGRYVPRMIAEFT